MLPVIVQVALGGAIGASLRYLSNISALRLFGPGFPLATMFVNILGSLIMGALIAMLAHKGGMRYTPFLVTGVLGGFTTFSAFSLDAYTLYERGQAGLALVYVMGTVVLSLVAVAIGILGMRAIVT